MTNRPVDSRNPMDAPPGVQCTARSKRSGVRCRRSAMLGGNVCRAHGGAAPQTRARAQSRLNQAADVLVQRLLGLALDGDAPDAVALAAIRDALDRAGMSAKQAVGVEVAVEVPAWQQMMQGMTAIRRVPQEQSRAERGLIEPPRELTAADPSEPIDAELVRELPAQPDEPLRPPPWEGMPPPPSRPGTELLTAEDAAAFTADLQRRQDAAARAERRSGRIKRVPSRRV